MLPLDAVATSSTRLGRNGEQANAPTAQHRNTVWRADTLLRTTFSVTTPPAYAAAAMRQSSVPSIDEPPVSAVARAMTAVPPSAIAPPANTCRENPSLRT